MNVVREVCHWRGVFFFLKEYRVERLQNGVGLSCMKASIELLRKSLFELSSHLLVVNPFSLPCQIIYCLITSITIK